MTHSRTFRSSLRSPWFRGGNKASSHRASLATKENLDTQTSSASTSFSSTSDDEVDNSTSTLHEEFLTNLPRAHRVNLEVSVNGQVKVRKCLVDDEANVFLFVSKLRATVFGKISKACLLERPGIGMPYEPTQKLFAVKEYRKSLMARSCTRDGSHVAEDALSELVMQHSMQHPNVMNIEYCFHDDSKIYAAFPFAEGGDLFDFAKSGSPTSERSVCKLMKQLLQGVQYCHANGIAHHDISLENVVLQEKSPVLIDFGAACQLRPDGKGDFLPVEAAVRQGKRAYKAPELYNSKCEYDARKADVWALGVCMYMLIFQLEPWNEAVNTDEHYKSLVMQRRLPEALESWGFKASKNVVDVFEAVFQQDPSKRPTIVELLDMPFFA